MTKSSATHARQIVDFVFDETVAAAFPDMIRRSVPGYETVVPISGLIAARHARSGGNCYDLGCSLGATAIAILRQLETPNCRIIARRQFSRRCSIARARCTATTSASSGCRPTCATSRSKNACAVVMNYTLQFVPSADRLALLTRIREGLDPSGVLIVSEKVRFGDEWYQDYFDHTHVGLQTRQRLQRARGRAEARGARERADSGSHRGSRGTLRRGRVRPRARLVSLSELGVVRRRCCDAADETPAHTLGARWECAHSKLLPQWRTARVERCSNATSPRTATAATWLDTIAALPRVDHADVDIGATISHRPRVGSRRRPTRRALRDQLQTLQPWRKGPFSLFGVHIDTEWRSDWKWSRVAPHLSAARRPHRARRRLRQRLLRLAHVRRRRALRDRHRSDDRLPDAVSRGRCGI